jgi:hypothetical protein
MASAPSTPSPIDALNWEDIDADRMMLVYERIRDAGGQKSTDEAFELLVPDNIPNIATVLVALHKCGVWIRATSVDAPVERRVMLAGVDFENIKARYEGLRAKQKRDRPEESSPPVVPSSVSGGATGTAAPPTKEAAFGALGNAIRDLKARNAPATANRAYMLARRSLEFTYAQLGFRSLQAMVEAACESGALESDPRTENTEQTYVAK